MRATYGLRLIALAVLLLFAELTLIEHGVEHAGHEDEKACVECLVLPGFTALPAAFVAPARPPLPSVALVAATPLTAIATLILAYRGRAPPAND